MLPRSGVTLWSTEENFYFWNTGFKLCIFSYLQRRPCTYFQHKCFKNKFYFLSLSLNFNFSEYLENDLTAIKSILRWIPFFCFVCLWWRICLVRLRKQLEVEHPLLEFSVWSILFQVKANRLHGNAACLWFRGCNFILYLVIFLFYRANPASLFWMFTSRQLLALPIFYLY